MRCVFHRCPFSMHCVITCSKIFGNGALCVFALRMGMRHGKWLLMLYWLSMFCVRLLIKRMASSPVLRSSITLALQRIQRRMWRRRTFASWTSPTRAKLSSRKHSKINKWKRTWISHKNKETLNENKTIKCMLRAFNGLNGCKLKTFYGGAMHARAEYAVCNR